MIIRLVLPYACLVIVVANPNLGSPFILSLKFEIPKPLHLFNFVLLSALVDLDQALVDLDY